MYLEFYGLRDAAFELTPDPKFLYLTAAHREALANLKYRTLDGQAGHHAHRRSRDREDHLDSDGPGL